MTDTTKGYLADNAERIIGNKAPFTIDGRKLERGDKFHNKKLVETFEKIKSNKVLGLIVSP